jgi:hypothetical protein
MVGIVHAKVSTVADGSTATEVRTLANWNADHTIDGTVILSSGTSTNTPLRFTPGALNTTSSAGVMEFDGVCFYQTAIDATRQVTRTEQFITNQSSRTLTTSTSFQKIFDETTLGTLTIGPGSYVFDCYFGVKGLSTAAKFMGFGFGGTATISTQGWLSRYKVGGSLDAVSGGGGLWATAASTNVAQSTTQPAINAFISGKLVVGASGTVIPNLQITAANATAAILETDAFFRIYPIGSSVVGSVGNWS